MRSVNAEIGKDHYFSKGGYFKRELKKFLLLKYLNHFLSTPGIYYAYFSGFATSGLSSVFLNYKNTKFV